MELSSGNTPFDFVAPHFTLQEACSVSGVSEKDLRNWMAREVIDFGIKHRLGRWLFSGVEIIQLRVIADLISLQKVDPSSTLNVAKAVVGRFWEMSMKDEDGRNLELSEGLIRDTRLIIHFTDNGIGYTTAQWEGESYALPPTSRDGENQWTCRPHLVIPVDQIIYDTMNKLFAIVGLEADDDL